MSRLLALALLLVALLALLVTAVTWGAVAIPAASVARILWSAAAHRRPAGIDAAWAIIILDIRLPRVVLGLIVGAVLSVAGATYQALFRNPLADPYLIGVSSGASFGAALAILFFGGLTWGAIGPVPLAAFAFALLVTFLAYGLSRIGGQASVTLLVLAGVGLGSLFSAATTLLMLTAPSAFRAIEVFGWLLGSLATASWNRVLAVLPFAVAGLLVIGASAYRLDLLQLGEDQAAVLGVRVERLRLLLIVAASLSAAAVVSVSGIIGFVGLVVPHIVRLVWGPAHRFLLPASAILGAILLILADGLARTLVAPREVPLGVVTACIGVPFFLYLLRRQRQRIL